MWSGTNHRKIWTYFFAKPEKALDYYKFIGYELPDSRLRLPVVSDCSTAQTARVSSNLHSTSSMAVSRVPSPPPQEVNTPVAENWCYTQVNREYLSHIKDIYCKRMHATTLYLPPTYRPPKIQVMPLSKHSSEIGFLELFQFDAN
ncbi:PREDICTED: uncharacterized protein LOC108565274 [Nicrophorus vespilloides]|uniref:Uncharacterized protein LOC108565274 n=1 Tax=Nicrophorus vespilloides TaxID=110193 RepID=A0ABM1MZY3_NICVS|nr:PREDICTED: uncharacterized protein LOC108565274 [Nicrophorus vespilloides]